ncbi:glycoside hydrolase family 3 protein [Babjeviella inositovora NRRL Y-12698]|uniref:beta-glucosidase n=1 Tax=Babjeviella inositovora NRRL Y-12698 TaxID=984486 RepID=A0A1E3QTB5_9ASCO|nr:glycoside hydrolase family 3 protein [Babjeviella inositovora NRRL Y-12698]ODQ80945.1 glycoside hydrolase family 3 protein [Babjeviella inositovora NRRL Y-12698]
MANKTEEHTSVLNKLTEAQTKLTGCLSPNFDIDEILNALTVTEKISLLAGGNFWSTNRIDRLNIPAIRFSDGPNGVRGTKFFNSQPSNCFPCGTALAATFNKASLVRAGKMIGAEAKLKSVHAVLGPMCAIIRSPLAGRAFEGFSEDPTLCGFAAAAVVSGIQSTGVTATLKHFVCNDQEYDKRIVNCLVSDRALREIYLLPFQIGIRDSNPALILTAYQKVNGEYCSDSYSLLNKILREEWGWKGTVALDWFSSYSVAKSVVAGMDLEMPGPPRWRTLKRVANEASKGNLKVQDIHEAARNVLKLIKRGIQSGIPLNGGPQTSIVNDETKATLRDLCLESIVLMKNEDGILPLKTSDSICVIGPLGKVSSHAGGGTTVLKQPYYTNIYDSVNEKVRLSGNSHSTWSGSTSDPPTLENAHEIPYAIGATIHKEIPGLGQRLINNKGQRGYMATFYLEPPTAPDRTIIDQFYNDESYFQLIDYSNYHLPAESFLFYVTVFGWYIPDESGLYEFGVSVLGTAQLFVDDHLVVDNLTKQTAGNSFFSCGTIEEKGYMEMEKGRKYKVRMEFGSAPTYTLGKKDPNKIVPGCGGFAFGCCKVIDPVAEIQRAVEIASKADKVIMCIGLSHEWEAEGFDRKDLSLPGYTNQLVAEVAKVNSNIVVVNQSGTPIDMPWLDGVKGLLQAWYGGNELGNSVADVLYGDVCPLGKLPMTWPKRIEDNPTYLTFDSNNSYQVVYGEDVFVGYRYYEKMKVPVLFPFGFGLSYTKFDLSEFNIKMTRPGTVSCSVKVKNIGDVSGAECVQFYVQQENTTVVRPVKELKDYLKTRVLKPMECEVVSVDIPVRYATSYWDSIHSFWCSEKGYYKVLACTSSELVSIEKWFNVKKTDNWLGI